MLGLKNNRVIVLLVLFTSFVIPTGPFALAESMSSTNYKIQTDVMSIGGGNSGSTNYGANDTVGDLATGENLASTNYLGCAGFECFHGAPFITFSVTAGLSAPGTSGTPIPLGALTTAAVTTSNGTTVNSAFLALESNAGGGVVVTVADDNNGLKSPTNFAVIASSTATLVAGTEGYGVCIFSHTQSSDSPTTFNALSPYNGSCDHTTGHAVGLVATTPHDLLSSAGQLSGGAAEILVKASVSSMTAAASDYTDNLTFIATGTY